MNREGDKTGIYGESEDDKRMMEGHPDRYTGALEGILLEYGLLWFWWSRLRVEPKNHGAWGIGPGVCFCQLRDC